MRTRDRQRLSEPLREGGDVERETTRALGVVLPNVERLEAEIFGDLREAAPHGISWWSELAAERRILIGDQLYACVQSIATNMVEARLHFLELLDWAERTGTRVETVFGAETGGVRVVAVRLIPNRRRREGLTKTTFRVSLVTTAAPLSPAAQPRATSITPRRSGAAPAS